jgi:hypothetical protein
MWILFFSFFLFSCTKVDVLDDNLDEKTSKTKNFFSSHQYILYEEHRIEMNDLLNDFAVKLYKRNPHDFPFPIQKIDLKKASDFGIIPSAHFNNLKRVFQDDELQYRSYILVLTLYDLYLKNYKPIFLKYEINEKRIKKFHNVLIWTRHQLAISPYILTDSTYRVCENGEQIIPFKSINCQGNDRYNYTYSSLLTKMITYTKDDYFLIAGGHAPSVIMDLAIALLL